MSAEPSPTFLLLHGFAQTGRCLGPLAGRLGACGRVMAPDLPGHGDGGPVRGDLWWGADRLAEMLAPVHRDGGVVHVVGYSMGGRLALHLALAHPDLVGRLTLIGATAGLDSPTDRAGRRADDETRARRIEEVGVAAFLEEWLALPLFAELPAWARFTEERSRNSVAGLTASLRRWGTGSQDPLWDRLAGARVPTTALAGALDDRFAALADRLASTMPHGRVVIVEAAGHAAHLEAPDAVLEAILAAHHQGA